MIYDIFCKHQSLHMLPYYLKIYMQLFFFHFNIIR